MRVVSFKKIHEFIEKHPDAKVALHLWYNVTTTKNWNDLSDVKKVFNSVDYIGNHRYVFNIKGNHYRLIAIISFNAKKVYLRYIGTHKAYDKLKNIKTF
ncbi:MAG: type II toxin-antitoxin system HigB family toxin [Flavobacteriaceae bacterium]|nr:type II toxin-antitoxin system HigB family toxin [Flavobacteriaceae bacterium]MCI5087672.1 type II toxin-antitoxin system HigB family toxin [Flavobacteriaceae bacterium]